jgi:hypothetical protein
MEEWLCACCGQSHTGVPLSFAADFPDAYANMAPAQRAERAVCSSDQCIIDDEIFAIRGIIELPVRGTGELFLWGVWATVWPEDFEEISESWEEEGRETRHGPFKGRLANQLSEYQNTLNLKVSVIIQPAGKRPVFVIEEPHPLATQQKEGISHEDARQMAGRALHYGTLPDQPKM